MNWNEIEGNWEKVKGKAREMWGKLTDDDLDVIKGKKQQLMGALQNRYGYTQDQAQKELDKFANSCNCSDKLPSKKDQSDHSYGY